ncbi:MAG: riboflavin kinase [Chitinispirillaceae bacterium]
MKTITHERPVGEIGRSVVSVGNFDGVHRGHRQLASIVRKRAGVHKASSVMVTFDPHTRTVIHPNRPQQLLTTFDEKQLLFEQLGIDYLIRIPFNAEYAKMSSESFVEQVLIKRLHAVEWVMGENHTFGKDRKSGEKFLHEYGGRNHFSMFIADLHAEGSAVISSTAIRTAIRHSKVESAVSMLGHPYLILAQRISGVHKGTEMGVPTLNFRHPGGNKVMPPPGVYAAELAFGKRRWAGALYFGNCPTFIDRDFHFEFHAFEQDREFPELGDRAALWMHRFIRADRTFDNERKLVEQIRHDINRIRTFFSQEQSWYATHQRKEA